MCKKQLDVHKTLEYTNLRLTEETMICFVKGDDDMPLSMAATGEENVIRRIGGKEETRLFLEKLGFVVGSVVTVISEASGNLIVNIKDSRVAIGKEMANHILV